MTQSILSVSIPLGICRAFVMLPGLGGEELSENLCPGMGHLSILLDAVNVVLFSIFHLKKYVYLNNFKEVKRYNVVLAPSLPYPTIFFCIRLLPAIVIISHMEENRS